ncbi:MAG: response regulator [Candidatus Nanopelagicales bacterium]
MFRPSRSAVLIEDEALTRALLESLLATLGFTVTAVDNAAAGIKAVSESDPDLLISDLDLGDGPSGAHAIEWTERNCPWVAVVILTIHRNPLLAEPSVLCDNPNRVHLVKDDIRSAKDLQEGIEAAIQGTKFSLVNTATALVITKDQADVLRLMARGMSNKEIARVRETTLGAVENITQRIYSNLRLTGDDSINPRAKAIAMYQNSQVTVA